MSHHNVNYEKALTELKGLYDTIQSDLANMNLPCRKKCERCCYYSISLTTLEGKFISTYLRTLEPNKAMRLASNIDAWMQRCKSDNILHNSFINSDLKGIEDRTFNAKIPCPLLLDSECGIYPVRPLVCRAYFHTGGPDACSTGIKDPRYVTYFEQKHKALLAIHNENKFETVDYTVLSLFCVKLLYPSQ